MFQTGTFWLVLALTVPLFWVTPKRLRLSFLTLVSMGYLGLMAFRVEVSWFFVAALVAWTLLFYYLAPLTVRGVRAVGVGIAPAPSPARRRLGRCVFWLLIISMVAYLTWYKLGGIDWFESFFPSDLPRRRGHGGANLLIPLGISYFTFKFIHYVIEVARGNIKDRSLPRFFCYIFLFPIFGEGPIERFDHFLANQQDRLTTDAAVAGLMRIVTGLIKKFFIAEVIFGDNFVHTKEGQLLRSLHSIKTVGAWSMTIGVYLYEYFDFAGYTDIAIGSCQLMGLGIMENFDWPLLAPNISVFWKRWHMTLTGWCISYIYMPVMGLTRRPNLATYATFIVMGLWHLQSPAVVLWAWRIPMPIWVLWGLYQATGLVLYQFWARFKRKRKWTFTDRGPWRWPCMAFGIAATILFISAGELIPFGGVRTFHDIGLLARKLVFINVTKRS